ncbi:uncharacterized protein RHO25_009270 [Cercospora beticola]|uniref:Uncharacterized protein n=1 Tax=Cercospora beticola TaxID=122368 RepID=A0ABZ0NZ27_CERBT|nr:hypothetical protein RHO25_009270 [Cercospora beticola]CAK1364370.1 unnamed protein product [Cercospora beticola]
MSSRSSMQYDDFLDTDIPYNEIPPEYLPSSSPPTNPDAGHQLQQAFTEAIRRAARPEYTSSDISRAVEVAHNIRLAIEQAAATHETLFNRYKKLPQAVNDADTDVFTAEFRQDECHAYFESEGHRRFSALLERVLDVDRMLENGRYKDAFERACTFEGEIESVYRFNEELERVVAGLEERAERYR